MVILQAERLSKRFGDLQAVEDLSFCVEEGDIYGFLGPNGAGKTTSIRMMLGLIDPTSGTARVCGHDIRSAFKRAIRPVGAMIEGPAFYGFLSGRRNLRLFGRLSGGVSEERIDEILRLVGLGRRGDHKVGSYSKGMRQRLGIALALLERPRLLILDEPTDGLDPQGVREIRNLLRHVRDREGTTVFLSSHLLSEVEQICDRIAVVYRGRIREEGRLSELMSSCDDVAGLEVSLDEDHRAEELLRKHFDIEAEILRRGYLEFPKTGFDLAAVNRVLVEAGLSVASLSSRRPTLEEYFVGLTGESGEVY
jgi:ABC-2 type transport system ATP-binding protein